MSRESGIGHRESTPKPDGWVAGARSSTATSGVVENAFFEYLLRLADDRLVLGHRLSEWCGHGPILEEDIALANIALDLVGQASMLLKLAGEVEGRGRSEDTLAYFRDTVEFRNVQLVELPNGDFAATIVRQFLFDAWDVLVLEKLLSAKHESLAGIAAKALKEAKYHLRHSAEWVRMLGDGTAESHARTQRALDDIWPYAAELFLADDTDRAVIDAGNGVDVDALRAQWQQTIDRVIGEATLTIPKNTFTPRGGRTGRHTEHLGRMLADMQSLARAHPGASW
ncbi:MAG TPA: 1,2-phenylacetyl-CoA epoxidase subunit PaaC [Gemmatimonadaceae bacterium]|nr:1,2-phenylacetyl-CoA epoxidase subunit PaaC [Gemmatimonadaceae bacterium]